MEDSAWEGLVNILRSPWGPSIDPSLMTSANEEGCALYEAHELISLTFEEPLPGSMNANLKFYPDYSKATTAFKWIYYFHRTFFLVLFWTERHWQFWQKSYYPLDVEGNATKLKFTLIRDHKLPRLIDFILLFYSCKEARSKKIPLGNSPVCRLRSFAWRIRRISR